MFSKSNENSKSGFDLSQLKTTLKNCLSDTTSTISSVCSSDLSQGNATPISKPKKQRLKKRTVTEYFPNNANVSANEGNQTVAPQTVATVNAKVLQFSSKKVREYVPSTAVQQTAQQPNTLTRTAAQPVQQTYIPTRTTVQPQPAQQTIRVPVHAQSTHQQTSAWLDNIAANINLLQRSLTIDALINANVAPIIYLAPAGFPSIPFPYGQQAGFSQQQRSFPQETLPFNRPASVPASMSLFANNTNPANFPFTQETRTNNFRK